MAARSDIFSILFILTLAVVGVGLALWPKSIQAWILKRYESWSGLAAWNPFLPWMKTPSYGRFLRALGISICAVVVLVLVSWD